jgi:EAL domain-containing protein (putative c-di-GMP-specific phosphodiesterase class I)
MRTRHLRLGSCYLKRVGCTEAQGYLFSKAVHPEDINTLLNLQAVQAKALVA